MLGGIVKAVAGNVLGRAVGGLFGDKSNGEMANMNADMQREFAQNGIRWKVEDARAAGIHPMYALGAQTHSFQPSAVGDTSFGAQMGQDITRAMHATRTAPDRAQAVLNGLTIDRAKLENDLLRTQIQNSKAALLRQVGPPMPTRSGVNEIGLQENPAEVTVPDPANSGLQMGRGRDPAMVEIRTVDGGTMLVPSQLASEGIESNVFKQIESFFRNDMPFYMNKVGYKPVTWKGRPLYPWDRKRSTKTW